MMFNLFYLFFSSKNNLFTFAYTANILVRITLKPFSIAFTLTNVFEYPHRFLLLE